MKVRNVSIILLIISVFTFALICVGCHSSDTSKGEGGNASEEAYENVIAKVYATKKKISIVFAYAKNNPAKNDISSFLSERGIAFSYLSDKKDKLIYEHNKEKYTVEPTAWLEPFEMESYEDIANFVQNTLWGSVICVDMSSTPSEEQLMSVIEYAIDAYVDAGYELLTPEELLCSDEKPNYEDDLDIMNYPELTTPIPFGIEESNQVDDSYFNDAVFIGDSITQKLQMYVSMVRKSNPSYLGEAKFLCSASLGASNSLSAVTKTSLHPSYNGVKQPLWDSVAQMGAKKVYIMLGVNDLTWASNERVISNLRKLISNIKESSPDAEIYVQSVTPRVARYEGLPGNKQIFEFNLELIRMCRDDGYRFVDTAYAFRDENGNLPDEYCSDLNSMGMHFTNAACEVWVDYLRTHTPR